MAARRLVLLVCVLSLCVLPWRCALAEPHVPVPQVRVLWVASQPNACIANLPDREGDVARGRVVMVTDCAAQAEGAVQAAFAKVAAEQEAGWRLDVTVRGFLVQQHGLDLDLTLDLAVTEPGEKQALLRAKGQGHVALEAAMTDRAFAARVSEALSAAADEATRLLRNRVSMQGTALHRESRHRSWLGLEVRTPPTLMLSGQRRLTEQMSLLLQVNPGWPSPFLQAGARLELYSVPTVAWQAELSSGVQWPAWWRAACKLSQCGDLDQRVTLVWLQLGTGVVVTPWSHHALRVDVGLQAGAQWRPLEPVGSLARGVFSAGYAYGF